MQRHLATHRKAAPNGGIDAYDLAHAIIDTLLNDAHRKALLRERRGGQAL